MCASRCIADSQCAVGEQCVSVGACAAPQRGLSPCAFPWPAAFNGPLDAGVEPGDASAIPDGGGAGGDAGPPLACIADIFEPNNSFLEATPAPEGAAVELSICSQDRDLFAVQALRGDEIGALVEHRYDEGDLDLALFFDGRTLAISQDTQDTEEIRHVVELDGEYIFEVYGFPADVETTYQLRTYRSRAPCETDAFEENDNVDEAAPIELGERIEATLCPTDTSDFFSVEIPVSDVEIEVRLNYVAPPGMRLNILSPDGQSSFSESGLGEEVMNFIAPQAGTFWIQVSGSVEEGQTGQYSLFANSIAPPCGDDFEPNDAPGSATAIALPANVAGVVCPADFDYYGVDVPAGGTLNVFFDGVDVFGSVLRWSDFELLATLRPGQPLELQVDDDTESLLILVGPTSTSDVGLPYTLLIE